VIRAVLLAVLGLIVVVVYVGSRQHLKFDVPYPAVQASTDPAVIERGRYVVRNLASCGVCHGDPAQHEALANGADVPLSGGHEWDIPPGHIFARKMTPDP